MLWVGLNSIQYYVNAVLKISDPEKLQSFFLEISVNHPLRFKGITVYQADWSLAAITLQLGDSPQLQLPLSNFPELGEQIWGLVIPTKVAGSEPILMSLSSEEGPIKVFNEGKMMRDFTYIDDIVESVIRLISKPSAPNLMFDTDSPDPSSSWAPHRIFNIGNSNPTPLMEYIEALEKALGIKSEKIVLISL